MRFVVLGDLHYSSYSHPDYAAARDRLFISFFQQVAALNADLVFAVGDTTNAGTLAELVGLDAIAQACHLPLIRVVGNHDSYSLEKSKLRPFFLGDYAPAASPDLYTSFDIDATRFMLLDTARERDDDNYGGWVSATQTEWLTQEIQSFNQTPQLQHLIVMGHHPLWNTTRRSTEAMLYIENSDQLATAFAHLTRETGFYFCGHNHNHSIYQHFPWHYVQTGNPLDCKSFRLVTLDAEQVRVETLDFDLSDPDLQADFEITRSFIPEGFVPQAWEVAYGEVGDRILNWEASPLPTSVTPAQV